MRIASLADADADAVAALNGGVASSMAVIDNANMRGIALADADADAVAALNGGVASSMAVIDNVNMRGPAASATILGR